MSAGSRCASPRTVLYRYRDDWLTPSCNDPEYPRYLRKWRWISYIPYISAACARISMV